jgi:predicted AlkP superfamily pyrophosphatase or phosphodiesterase
MALMWQQHQPTGGRAAPVVTGHASRRWLFLALAASLLTAVATVGLAQTKPRTSGLSRPRLVLVLSVDQLAFDTLMKHAQVYTGGLRRLLDGGAVFTQAFYRHAVTETAPGHATILSGRHPSDTGIVSNDWYDRALGVMVNAVDDSAQHAVGGAGRAASPARFIGSTLGDVLKSQDPRSKVIGVSAKDRAAILLAGPRADAAYWFESAAGGFVTSSYYMAVTPPWLAAWNARRLADAYDGTPWTRLRSAPSWYEQEAGPDDADGEADPAHRTFPHTLPPLTQKRAFYEALVRTPAGDELTLSAALGAMAAYGLGLDDSVDLLAIGFSSTDFVGHTYGADSQEMLDQLLRLDVVLGRLFTEVDARIGVGRTLVVMTADHGAVPVIEQLQRRGVLARRVDPAVFRDAVSEALARRFPGVGGLVARTEPDVYLDDAVIRRSGLVRQDVAQAVSEGLLSTGLVAQVYSEAALSDASASPDPFVPLFRNARFAPRSPDLFVLLKPYVYVTSAAGGTGHGTAHEYDRHVPMVFMGQGITPGRYSSLSGPEDIAPTLAWLLGVTLPPASDARLLTEMTPEQRGSLP